MRKDNRKIMERINKIRQLMSKAHSPLRGMTKEQIIEAIRKTREELWEKKLAAHS